MGAFGWGPWPTSVVVLVLVLVWMLVLMLVVLNFVEVVVSGNGHTDDQQHGLVEAELLVLVQIKVLHYLVNGGLVFHVLQRKGCGEGKVPSSRAQASPRDPQR